MQILQPTLVKPEDVEKYWLSSIIYGNDDQTHAVEALRKKFDAWKEKEKRTTSLSNYRKIID